MFDSSYFLWWIFCAIVGGAVGLAKDRASAGILLGALLGPIGVIIALFLSDDKKKKEEASRNQLLAIQLQIQQAQIQKPPKRRFSAPPPPDCEPKLRIASNGQDLGEMPVQTVKNMLKSGNLMQIDCCPDLV